jgi:hypothetical protein
MSPPTTWQTSMVLPFISTATCMDSKYCRNFARSQDVKYVLLIACASTIVCSSVVMVLNIDCTCGMEMVRVIPTTRHLRVALSVSRYECVHNTSLMHPTLSCCRLTAHGVSRLVAFVQEHKQQLAQQPGDPRTPEGRDFLY